MCRRDTGMIEINPQSVADAIQLHRSTPSVSLDAHVKARMSRLGQSLANRKKLYLDKRYWIILRDTELGRAGHDRAESLLEMLRRCVEIGACICPISESIFLELLKQHDLCTRRKTALLIDELSQGVTLVPVHQRIAQEIVGFLAAHIETGAVYPVNALVWSKVSYILGVTHPTHTGLSQSDELAAQKAFFDFMWQLSLANVLDCLDDAEPPAADFDGLAGRINELNIRNSKEVRSFKGLYLDEFRGGLSLFMNIPRKYFQDAYERQTGKTHSSSAEEDGAHEAELLTFFGNLIAKKDVALLLPTLHIDALCNAAVRWDKARRLRSNDFYDFRHACAAIPYCDLFLTERPLRTLLRQRHLELQSDFNCEVISEVGDAETWIIENVSL